MNALHSMSTKPDHHNAACASKPQSSLSRIKQRLIAGMMANHTPSADVAHCCAMHAAPSEITASVARNEWNRNASASAAATHRIVVSQSKGELADDGSSRDITSATAHNIPPGTKSCRNVRVRGTLADFIRSVGQVDSATIGSQS